MAQPPRAVGRCHLYNSHPGVRMKYISAVIQQLKREHQHLQQQLKRIDEALAALGSSSNGTRTISAAGRRRISLAQKKRWAKVRSEAKWRSRSSRPDRGHVHR